MTYVNVNGSVSMTSPARDVAPATYTISELAAEFDITPRAIRFYEDMGLLNPARDGRNRVYSVRDRTRLKLTLRGKRLGLSLVEIRELVDMYESPADTAPPTPKAATRSASDSPTTVPAITPKPAVPAPASPASEQAGKIPSFNFNPTPNKEDLL